MKNLINISKEDLEFCVYFIKTPVISSNIRYLMDRLLRRVHDASEFGMTPLAEKHLKEFDLYESETFGKYKKTKYNRELKKIGFHDSLMIEHMYSVKKMVNDLFNLKDKFDGINDTSIVLNYLENKTDCIMKFSKLEKELHG